MFKLMSRLTRVTGMSISNERYLNFAHTTRATFQDFVPGHGEFPKYATGVTFGEFPAPGAKS